MTPFPSKRPKLDTEAVKQKWTDYLQRAYEARAGLRPKPPLVILKYKTDGTIEVVP